MSRTTNPTQISNDPSTLQFFAVFFLSACYLCHSENEQVHSMSSANIFLASLMIFCILKNNESARSRENCIADSSAEKSNKYWRKGLSLSEKVKLLDTLAGWTLYYLLHGNLTSIISLYVPQ